MVLLLWQLKWQLRNAVSISVIKDAYRLVSYRITILLIEVLWCNVHSRAIRRSVWSILFATQHFGLLLGDERTSCSCLSLLGLLLIGDVVLLLLKLCQLFLIFGNIGAAYGHGLKSLLWSLPLQSTMTTRIVCQLGRRPLPLKIMSNTSSR